MTSTAASYEAVAITTTSYDVSGRDCSVSGPVVMTTQCLPSTCHRAARTLARTSERVVPLAYS